jgi:hypothetical protein
MNCLVSVIATDVTFIVDMLLLLTDIMLMHKLSTKVLPPVTLVVSPLVVLCGTLLAVNRHQLL